jgi:ABC-type amino acid transport substrate-binding protein
MSFDARITRPSDLAHYRTGVMDGSLAQNVLSSLGVTTHGFPTVEAGLKALSEKKITAFADGEESLRYVVNRDYPEEITVESLRTTRLAYAFAARPGFPAETLKAINVELIDLTTQPEWEPQIERWIGPPSR